MRIARKLTLLALAAVAAMAFMASSASATNQVEVVNEKTGTHCALSGANQCNLHVTGLATLRVDLGIFGEAHEATCNLEIQSRLDETGGGRIDSVEKTPGDANCATVTTECNLPWTATGEEDGTPGVVQSSAAVCLDPAEGPVCQGNQAFDIVEGANETYTTEFNNSSVGLCELDVALEMESQISSNARIHANH